MILKQQEKELMDVALVLNPQEDNVAIAKQNIESGTQLQYQGDVIAIQQDIQVGHRFALKDIPEGNDVKQHKSAFGRSQGIVRGELIATTNLDNILPEVDWDTYQEPAETRFHETYIHKTFEGYLRKDGLVGTRNYYLVVPTSMCASETAMQIAFAVENDKNLMQKYPSLDGVLAIPHTEGCGCDAGLSVDRLMRVLKGYVSHPNVCGCLIIDLGCEQTNYEKVQPYFKSVMEKQRKPIDWITIEESGGVLKTRDASIKTICGRLPEVADVKRQTMPLEYFTLGTECGASDSFSGITANPLIGNVVDKVIHGKGSAILTEIPEMVGVLPMLLSRFRSKDIAMKFQAAVDWYQDMAERLGLSMTSNLVPKNVEGGLINNCIKSLGAVMKGGTSAIEDVIDYGGKVKQRGLSIMQGPGGDLESVTGMVASGANLVCFSTGRGTPTGNAICPVIKIASTSEIFKKLSNDIDFNAGRLLEDDGGIDSLGDELLDLIIDVASGKKTAAERLNQRQFQIWTAGKLSL